MKKSQPKGRSKTTSKRARKQRPVVLLKTDSPAVNDFLSGGSDGKGYTEDEYLDMIKDFESWSSALRKSFDRFFRKPRLQGVVFCGSVLEPKIAEDFADMSVEQCLSAAATFARWSRQLELKVKLEQAAGRG